MFFLHVNLGVYKMLLQTLFYGPLSLLSTYCWLWETVSGFISSDRFFLSRVCLQVVFVVVDVDVAVVKHSSTCYSKHLNILVLKHPLSFSWYCFSIKGSSSCYCRHFNILVFKHPFSGCCCCCCCCCRRWEDV